MNLNTQLVFAFAFIVFLTLTLVLGTRWFLRWRRLRREAAGHRDELRRAEQEALAHAQQEQLRAEQMAAATVETDASATDTQPTATTESEQPQPATASEPANVPEPVAAAASGPYQSWTPPQAATWEPTAGEDGNVSWTNSQLFHTRDEHFTEPDHIPKVTADQVPGLVEDDYVFGSATPALAALMPESDVPRVESDLKRAGYYQPHARQNLSAIRFVLILASLSFFGVLLLLSPPEYEVYLGVAMLVASGALWAIPRLIIQNRGAERRSQMERAMPDMLDMLNMCVSQGLTIRDSIKRIATDLRPVYPALAGELAIVTDQSEVGSMQIALDNFAERVDVPEVDSFVSLINQSERMGTSVSDALTEYSNTMRESLRQRTDEKANSASFKLMFPTVLFMMPAVFMFLMGPAILELQDFFDAGGIEGLEGDTGGLENIQNVVRNPQAGNQAANQ